METVPSGTIPPIGSTIWRELEYKGRQIQFRWLKEQGDKDCMDGVWYVQTMHHEPWKNNPKRKKDVHEQLILARFSVKHAMPAKDKASTRLAAILGVPGVKIRKCNFRSVDRNSSGLRLGRSA